MLVVRTQPAKKRKESKALTSCIKRTGFEMFLCLNCKRGNKKCLVSDKENSSCCFECVLRGASCDVEGVLVGEWRALEAEEACIKAEKETAFRLVCENMSCIKRFERQQEFLKSKGKDMVRRGLKTLDKLEKAEERERQIESKQAATAAMLSSSPRPDAPAPRAKGNPFASLEVPLLPPKV
jgi:hypothetical protein